MNNTEKNAHTANVFVNYMIADYSATIDRIDNSKDYIRSNIRIISAKANIVKNNCTIEELELILGNWKKLEKKFNHE